jgi:hypothetical protein
LALFRQGGGEIISADQMVVAKVLPQSPWLVGNVGCLDWRHRQLRWLAFVEWNSECTQIAANHLSDAGDMWRLSLLVRCCMCAGHSSSERRVNETTHRVVYKVYRLRL